MQNIYSIYSRLNLFYETLLVKLKFLLLFSQLIKKKKIQLKPAQSLIWAQTTKSLFLSKTSSFTFW